MTALPGRGTSSFKLSSAAARFAYCEPVIATGAGRWHIREVGPEGIKLGGGVPNDALCGRALLKGWDLKSAVTTNFSTRLVTPRAGDGNVALCPACHEAWLAATSGGTR